MFYNILSKERLDILPLLTDFKSDFYLAGGTALALQIGHRDSVDFDFFSNTEFDTHELFERVKKIFSEQKILKVQDEKNSLTVIISDKIKLSFFYYNYSLIKPLIGSEYFQLATIYDIACMKFSAIVGRASVKDYVDLYFILQKFEITELIELTKKKMPELDTNLILKSLVYFDDIQNETLIFKTDIQPDLPTLKDFFITQITKFNHTA